MLVNLGLSVFFICPKTWNDCFAKSARIRMEPILFAKILVFNKFLDFLSWGGSVALFLNLFTNLLESQLVHQKINSRCWPCAVKNANILLVSTADALYDMPCFFPGVDCLLARSWLLAVRISVNRHYLLLNVVFYESKTFAWCCVICVHHRLFAVDGLDRWVEACSDCILPYIFD